jgi:DNA modification methylase
MKIKKYKIKDLIRAEYNPRKLSRIQEQDLRDSLTRFGLVDPVIVNTHPERKNIIIGGHQRVKVWESMGNTEVDCTELSLTLDREKELNIRLNKNTGSFDEELLKEYFKYEELIEYGFTTDELFIQEEEVTDGKIGDDEIPEVKNTKVKQGEIWKLGEHRLMCGDSTNPKDVDKLMNNEKASLVFTDPPYGISYTGSGGSKNRWEMIKNDDLRGDGLYKLLSGAFEQLFIHTIENPAVYVWHSFYTQMIFEKALVDTGFKVKEQIIWNKGMTLSGADYQYAHETCFYVNKNGKKNNWYGDRKHKTILRYENDDLKKFKKDELIRMIESIKDNTSTWEIKKDAVQTYIHPTQKPVDLCLKGLLNNTERNEIVIDLFLGSGSTLIAAEKVERRCYGMELDPKYASLIIERYEQYTGKKAEKII